MHRKPQPKQTNTLGERTTFRTRNIPNSSPNIECDSTSSSSANSTEISSFSSSSSSLDTFSISKEESLINEMIADFIKTDWELSGKQKIIPYESVPTDKIQLQRAFIEGIAWACASDKNAGSETCLHVTAAAMESCKDGKSILWLAANNGIDNDILSYAGRVIRTIKSSAVELRKRQLLNKSVASNANDLNMRPTCKRSLGKNITPLVEQLVMLKQNHINGLREAFCTSINGLMESLKGKLPHSDSVAEIPDIICWLQLIKEKISPMPCHEMVMYLSNCKYDKAYINLHTLFQLTELTHLRNFSFYLYDIGKSLLVAQMLQSAANSLDFLEQEVLIKAYGSNQYPNKSIQKRPKPAVHAEIYLVELFCRSEKDILNGDDFVGCSKPACFFCRLYIEKIVNPLRNRRFHVRRAHDKVYFWLFPRTHLLKALPGMTPLSSSYVWESYTIFEQEINNWRKKFRSGRERIKLCKDDPIGLPPFKFDEKLNYIETGPILNNSRLKASLKSNAS